MKKVIFLITSLNAGGIENYLLRFLRHFEGQFIPYIICKNGLEGDLQAEFQSIEYISFYEGTLGYLNPQLFLKLMSFFKSIQPDAICDFTGNFAGIPLFLARLCGVETRVAFYRGSTDHFSVGVLRNIYNNQMKNLVYKNATYILANSKSAMNYFFGNNYQQDSRFKVIYNGINSNYFLSSNIDLKDALSIQKNAFVVAHVGRYDESKNHKTIVKVIQKLISYDKEIVFILCGKNVDTALKEWVVENGYQHNVKLLGYTKDVIQVLNTADCFYFPSVTEGQPNALIEALIVGLPFAASNIPPIKEVIPNNFHKYLVEPTDDQDACEKILNIKKNLELRSLLNLSNWAKRNFDADILFTEFYNVLINDGN